MLFFVNDYGEGAHPAILEALAATNFEQLPGYGTDRYCASARGKIRAACECPDADVFFLAGGTQTNATVIDAMLMPYEGAVAAETGHISTHEAGAIECARHKVLALPSADSKLHADELRAYLAGFFGDANHEHMVFPGLVYVTHPTEYGQLYSREELEAVKAVCAEFDLPLYLDGARLGYALAAPGTDLSLPDIARIVDAFYIGGTKVGALCGEAVVFPHGAPAHFFTTVKQHGALLAKGRLLGVQFDTLFTNGLYERIARNAIDMEKVLKEALVAKGYELVMDAPTNQIFVRLADDDLARLQENVAVDFWEKPDADHTVVRFATSWATRREDVDALIDLL